MRIFSFAQESTRYCNYSRDKFDGVTFISPSWMPENIFDTIAKAVVNVDNLDAYWYCWFNSIWESEMAYLSLLNNYDNRVADKRFKTKFKGNPWTPQQARSVLPNALKTEINMCGFVSDWKHFFSLRSSHAGATGMHPDMDYIANKIYDEFLKRKYIN